METVTETITKTEDGDLSDLSDKTLRDLCLANHEARCHTLLYVVMTNTNGHQVSGHVDLADRVAKVSNVGVIGLISFATVHCRFTGRRGSKTRAGFFLNLEI